MSSGGFLDTSTSSNSHTSLKNSNLPNMNPSNKEPSAFHMDYVYPQGLPLKETQANLHLAEKNFNASKPKGPQSP